MTDALKQRVDRYDERIKKLQARKRQVQARIRKKAREEDTRRKILIGSMILRWIKDGKFSEQHLREGLDEYLDRKRDRALFDLPEAKENDDRSPFD